ncbi:probable receptor-like protein kinase At1g80640 [Benincasa hispida]|uniref:probable receptor-like protein kinase At1g80640 n=1 Tax=Benincasa hispida TaxID=102211 RepID=UPI0019009A5D|nr:probable receptor-like protein kinase At1g80640 [Benincasa hispida]
MEARTKMAVAVAVFCSSLLIAALFSLLWLWIHRKRRNAGKSKGKDAKKGIGLTPFVIGEKGRLSLIDFKVLEKATGNFEEGNVLGEGGFGRVYKALLDDNLVVAVKKIDCSGSQADREFENEVNILSSIHHPNIICQLGCSSEGDTKLIVYELMENGSLETQLHGPSSRGSALSWHMRMKTALDVARGLEYLHEHCKPSVIHRDLKTSNILLDSNFNAKIVYESNTRRLTEKSDVYTFGIVVLELLLGTRPMEKLPTPQSQSFITWAMPQLTDRSKLPNIVDPVIRNTMDLKHLYQVAAMAVLCVQGKPSYRPLIKDVLHSLVPLVPMDLGGTLRFNPHQ